MSLCDSYINHTTWSSFWFFFLNTKQWHSSSCKCSHGRSCLFLEEFPMISCTPVLGSVNFNLTGVSVCCISFGWNVTPGCRRIVRPSNYKRQQENFLIYIGHLICRDLCLSQGDQNNGAVHLSPDRGFQVTRGARSTSVTVVTFAASLHIFPA